VLIQAISGINKNRSISILVEGNADCPATIGRLIAIGTLKNFGRRYGLDYKPARTANRPVGFNFPSVLLVAFVYFILFIFTPKRFWGDRRESRSGDLHDQSPTTKRCVCTAIMDKHAKKDAVVLMRFIYQLRYSRDP